MSGCVYGSDHATFAALASTLLALAGSHTLIILAHGQGAVQCLLLSAQPAANDCKYSPLVDAGAGSSARARAVLRAHEASVRGDDTGAASTPP